jgi:hypothetical protein
MAARGRAHVQGTTSVVTFNHSVSSTSGWKIIALFTDLSFSARGVYRLTFTQPNFNLAVSTTVYVQGALNAALWPRARARG